MLLLLVKIIINIRTLFNILLLLLVNSMINISKYYIVNIMHHIIITSQYLVNVSQYDYIINI